MTLNETLNQTVSNIDLTGVKSSASSILIYIHSAGLWIATYLTKFIPVEVQYIYLGLFALISLWIGAMIIDIRDKKIWWLIVSAVIMYLLVWWV